MHADPAQQSTGQPSARRTREVPRVLDPRSCCSSSSRAATIKSPSFLFSGDGWRDLLLTPSILLLLAVGQAVVIITRNVDLSVGSVSALTAYLTGRLFIDHPASRSSWSSLAGHRWSAPSSA